MQAYVLRNVNLSLYPGELVAVVRLPLPKAFCFHASPFMFPNPPMRHFVILLLKFFYSILSFVCEISLSRFEPKPLDLGCCALI
jgi:hypothetical protein